MSFQQLILVGNPGGDPELRTSGSTTFANFSLAVNEKWTKADGTPVEKTTWFRCTAFGSQADVAAKFIKKGAEVMLIGTVDVGNVFTDATGKQRAGLEVKVQQIRLLQSGANRGGAPEDPAKDEDIPF